MTITTSELTTTALRQELATFLETLPASLAVTLRYESGPVTMTKLRRDLASFHAKLDRKLFGRGFTKSPVRTRFWAVQETLEGNPHVHCGWYCPNRETAWKTLKLLQSGLWEATIAPGGTHDIQPLITKDEWTAYATKSIMSMDDIILSSDKMLAQRGPNVV